MIHIGHSRVGPGDLIHGSETSIGPLDHELWVFSGQNHFFVFPGSCTYAFNFFQLFFVGGTRVASKLHKLPMYRCVARHVTEI